MANWHGQSAGQVLSALESDRERGLSREEAVELLNRYWEGGEEG